MSADLDALSAKITELEEEHSAEDAPFSGFDKISKATINERLREIGDDTDAKDEIAILRQWLKLNAEETELRKCLREAEAALDDKVYKHYPKLSVADVKALTVDEKWIATLDGMIHGEMDRVSQALTTRVKELAERYEAPLPDMAKRVSELEAKVNVHLAKMGFAA